MLNDKTLMNAQATRASESTVVLKCGDDRHHDAAGDERHRLHQPAAARQRRGREHQRTPESRHHRQPRQHRQRPALLRRRGRGAQPEEPLHDRRDRRDQERGRRGNRAQEPRLLQVRSFPHREVVRLRQHRRAGRQVQGPEPAHHARRRCGLPVLRHRAAQPGTGRRPHLRQRGLRPRRRRELRGRTLGAALRGTAVRRRDRSSSTTTRASSASRIRTT